MYQNSIYLSLILLLAGCSQSQKTDQAAETANAEKAVENQAVENLTANPHANPPIDCPLHKAGLDPTKMKPFEETEKYIQFLEREDRKIWQKPEEVVESMALTGSERIFDIGAGSGYFTFPMSQKLTTGRVFAGDVEPEMIRHIHHTAMSKGIENIEVRLISQTAPEVPEAIDLVFMCDVMHHIAEPEQWMAGITKQLPEGAAFHMIEFKKGDIPSGPPEEHRIAPERLKEIAAKAGLRFDHEVEGLLPYQYYLVFKK